MRLVVPAFLMILILSVSFTGCSNSTADDIEIPLIQITLAPYVTSTPTQIITPPQLLTTVPSPTDEPVIYTVVSGDSLSVIALRFGINLDALLQANPTVNPNAMSVGTKIIIPPKNDTNTTGAKPLTGLPTPAAKAAEHPDCYHGDSSEWLCFLLVHNDQAESISNITGQLIPAGSTSTFQATCPLDLLPAGESVPLVARIQNMDIDPDRIEGILTTATLIGEADDRFAAVQVSNQTVVFSADRRSAEVGGDIVLKYAGTLRVVAFAQDSEGHVLGFRVWESTTSLTTGTTQSFKLYLYSLGTDMAEIHLVAQVKRQ